MRKFITLIALVAFTAFGAQAQIGGLLNKAAKKVAEKTTEKAKDSMEEALNKKLGTNSSSKETSTTKQNTNINSEEDTPASIQELVAQMPELPSSKQLIDYKNAEAKEMTLKMMTSPVTMFRTQVVTLMSQANALVYADFDSTTVANMTMQYTGLTEKEIKAMENMTEEEQQAYIMAYYQSGKADEVRMKAVEKAAEYAKRTESLVEEYDRINDKVEALYKEADKKMAPIYKSYAKKLENLEGKDYQILLAEYYSKIVDIQRSAIIEAMKIREKEQLPIAENIEKINSEIRKNDKGIILTNYLQMWGISYFTETEHLFDTPTPDTED